MIFNRNLSFKHLRRANLLFFMLMFIPIKLVIADSSCTIHLGNLKAPDSQTAPCSLTLFSINSIGISSAHSEPSVSYFTRTSKTPKAFDLTGDWVNNSYACYDNNGNLIHNITEQIRIEQKGNSYKATKVTGDDCVPAGHVTFSGTSSQLTDKLVCPETNNITTVTEDEMKTEVVAMQKLFNNSNIIDNLIYNSDSKFYYGCNHDNKFRFRGKILTGRELNYYFQGVLNAFYFFTGQKTLKITIDKWNGENKPSAIMYWVATQGYNDYSKPNEQKTQPDNNWLDNVHPEQVK